MYHYCIDENMDKSEYFNAWNFGQPKGDYEPAISTAVTEPDYLGI